MKRELKLVLNETVEEIEDISRNVKNWIPKIIIDLNKNLSKSVDDYLMTRRRFYDDDTGLVSLKNRIRHKMFYNKK